MTVADGKRQELWGTSVCAYYEKRQADLRDASREYHERLAEIIDKTAAVIAAEHRARAKRLTQDGPKETA